MELSTVVGPFEIKFAGAGMPEGSFEGYGAVFNNRDLGGDVIDPGAFAKSLSMRDMNGSGAPRCLYNHEPGAVGVWDHVSEDKTGLIVKGRIAVNTTKGRDVYELARVGAIKGLSIGYRVPPNGSRYETINGQKTRRLKQVDLAEISLVDEPMNPQAKLNFIKSAQGFLSEIKTPREFEAALKEHFGFSNSMARAICERGFKTAAAEEEAKAVESLSAFEKMLREATKSIKA